MQALALAFPETQLVRVFTGQIDGIKVNFCDARELHAFLEVARDFSTWMNERIKKYGFEENRDFLVCSPNPGSEIALETTKAKRGGHNRKDYHLSLDMAKELSMVENNEQGRAARRYFIGMERKALEAASAQAPELPPLIAQRWLTTYDSKGQQHTRLLPMDNFVMSVTGFIAHLPHLNEHELPTKELFALAMQTMGLLQQRRVNS